MRQAGGARPTAVVLAFVLVCAAARVAAQQRSTDGGRSIAAFSGLARLFRELSTATSQATPEQAAAGLFDFEQVVAAVGGPPGRAAGRSFEEYRSAFAGKGAVTLPEDGAARARDDTAYRLHSLGYSAKEIADVLAGRISRGALDTAQKMLMVGYRRDQASDFLDREYRRLAAARAPSPGLRRGGSLPQLAVASGADALVSTYAARYGVDVALVRALIACESAWNQQALSRAGAVGVMQLMPGTARELGVDPHDLEQNIEGGIRYLASLLRTFRDVERALIAYNAGPGFAERYGRGQVALYGETREYVRNVLGRLAEPGRQPLGL